MDIASDTQYISIVPPTKPFPIAESRDADAPVAGGFLLGVLGGMGPAATADFYDKLIAACPARRDQDHVPVVIWADPSTPDRTDAILGDGIDPTPWLRHGAEVLRAAGATVIVVPCNTAHHFLEAATDGLGVVVIDMIDTAARSIVKAGNRRRPGILATDGTMSTGLYQRALRSSGLEPITPAAPDQERVMTAIRLVKGGELGRAGAALGQVISSLVADGADCVIAGCTEIPLAMKGTSTAVPLVDPSSVVAREIVDLFLEAGAARA